MSEAQQQGGPVPDGDGVTPQPGAVPRRRHRRVVRAGTETSDVSGVAEDERGSHGENDDRLLGDVPPHWGRR